jgi:hypothetical protein
LPDSIRSLGAHDRLAAIGVGVVALSLLLPWWGVTFAGGLVKTPAGSLGFVEAAIVITLAAAAYLIARGARGHALPMPLHVGTLIAAAGAWTVALTVYGIFDRPDFGLSAQRVGLRYGIFVALGGAALIVAGGLRRRRDELTHDQARSRDAGVRERADTRAAREGEKVGE